MAEDANKTTVGLPKPTVTLPRAPAPNQHNETGVVKIVGDSQIPREFITAGWSIDEAGVLSFLKDENEVNDITRLKSKADKFHVDRALDDLKFWLNLRRSILGRASLLSVMGHTGIIAVDALAGMLGIRLSGAARDDIERQNREHQRRRDEEEQKRG